MARYFKSPDSDQVEEVEAFQVLAILFMGVIYLFFAGLWRHLSIWLGIVAIGYGAAACRLLFHDPQDCRAGLLA